MKKTKIDFTLISDSGRWIVESEALSYHTDAPAKLVLNRKNEKEKWLVLAVGDSGPDENFPEDGSHYKEINPFTYDEFDAFGMEAVIRYYTFKALEAKTEERIISRILRIFNPPTFLGTISIEGLTRVPEKSQSELQKRLKEFNLFERVDLIETPT